MKALHDSVIGIVGLGLIGGSLARGLRKANPKQRLIACDANEESLASARQDGTIAEALSLSELCVQADIIVLATPPIISAELLHEVASVAQGEAILTDVASVKGLLAEAATGLDEAVRRRFVPAHPIAGSERSGYAAASDRLFAGRKVILTPLPENDPQAVYQVHAMWRLLGAEVLAMGLERHDQVLAATSHLPHLLAYAIVDVLAQDTQRDDIFRYAAGGFADFSRLASSDARMWSDIFVSNRDRILEVLADYSAELARLQKLIATGQREELRQLFARVKETRDRFMTEHFHTSSPAAAAEESVTFHLEPGGSLSGSLRVPGDKSISHRAIILGAIADGVTRVSGFLEGEDALNTLAAFREMGVTIVGPDAGEVSIYGVGKEGLKAPRTTLNMGNSGTAMRLLAGLLTAQDFDSELSGDESLNKRPMSRIAEPLRQMGACIDTAAKGRPPLRIGGASLKGIDYVMPVASAQVKSCLLLAGLYANGRTRVFEPAPCRDHTERMLRGFGCEVTAAGGHIEVSGGQRLTAATIEVPADISSAAFFMVAAAISPQSSLQLRHVGVNPTRIGIINLLRAMGASIELSNEREVGGEAVADVQVSHRPLHGIEIPAEQIPLAIDEFPALFIAAACARGETVLRGAAELRVKESDRIEAMASGLAILGVETEMYDDGIRIVGGELGGGTIDSRGDHRIAMAFSIAALRASAAITIRRCANVATSFPGFVTLAAGAGLRIREERGGDS